MGDAKRRGTQEQRVAAAQARLREGLPAEVTCNHCQATLTDIEGVDVRGFTGMKVAGVAHCPACLHDTWVLDGTPDAMVDFQMGLDSVHGADAVSSGMVFKPKPAQ